METMDLINLVHSGDKSARERLIHENMGLVYNVVKRFLGRGHEREDLIQIGTIGLMKAIDNFNTDFEVKFSTYAVPMISGEIKRFLRDDGMLKVSRSLKDTARRARLAAENLSKRLGTEPTLRQIADEIEVPPEEIAIAYEAVGEVDSLNRTIYQSDGSPILLMDRLETADPTSQLVNHVALEKVLKTLTKEEQSLIESRYFQDKTQQQIANELGISQVQVSRLEKKLLLRMRHQLC